MEGAGDIGVLSIPFAAGTAAGAVLASEAAGGGCQMPAAAVALMFSAIILIIGTRRRWNKLLCVFLFFFCGAFCYLSYGMLTELNAGGALAARAVQKLRGSIASVPYPHSDTSHILTALLTGDRSGISRETTAVFRAGGASHILALSGLHLGVIYMIMRTLTLCLGNTTAALRLRCALIVAASGFYTLMTGAGPSIIRAWLFITIRECGRLMPERKLEGGRTLAIALMLQLAAKPAVITSLGFQLSYLAMCGIVFLYPRLRSWYPDDGSRLLRKLDPLRRIWSGAALSISCQAFTAPLVWISFRTFPKFFIITNLTALPLTSVIIVAAVITTALYPTGYCPQAAVDAVDSLVQSLIWVLTVISSL